MKKVLFILLIHFAAIVAKGQQNSNFTYSMTIGTGISMNEPAFTPFDWQIIGHYKVYGRFLAGAGTGLSVYEKMLIPVFADLKFLITPPYMFTPFLECAAGYAFAPDRNANGGFYLNPSVGVQYDFHHKVKVLLAVGYELQKLERLKKYENNYFFSEFHEKLNHSSISVKAGIIF